MCKTNNPRKIDKCMIPLIQCLSGRLHWDYKILACCCGHGRYPKTLVIRHSNSLIAVEIFSNKSLIRNGKAIRKKFYVKDSEGYYYIPETITNSTQGVQK